MVVSFRGHIMYDALSAKPIYSYKVTQYANARHQDEAASNGV